MSVEEVALYNGHLESLKKCILPGNWREGFLSIICLPKPVTCITASGSHGIETTFSPIDYSDAINKESHLNPSSEYGLFFYSSQMMSSNMTTSVSLLSLHTLTNKCSDEADNVYDELPSDKENNRIFKKQLSLKQMKSKCKKKAQHYDPPPSASVNELTNGNSFFLLPLLSFNVHKSVFTVMSPIQCPHKSLKAGIHYPIWVESIIVFNGRYQSSQSLSSLLMNESNIEFTSSHPHEAQIPTMKVSLKQKLFGNRHKKSTNDSNHHYSSSQETQCPLIIGFRSSTIAKVWWQRIHDILSPSKSDFFSVPSATSKIFAPRPSVSISVGNNRRESKMADAYASLPRSIGPNSISLQAWKSNPSIASRSLLLVSEKVLRARASKKLMVLKDITCNDRSMESAPIVSFPTLLLKVSANRKTKKSSRIKVLPAPSTLLIQVIVPFGLRVIIHRSDGPIHFDILATSIERYSFVDNILLLELMERCLLSGEKEMIFQFEQIGMFGKEFYKLMADSSRDPSSHEQSTLVRVPPKPPLLRHADRGSSTSGDSSNPDDHVYAELGSRDPSIFHLKKEDDLELKIENPKSMSHVEHTENVEDPYNEGDIHGFVET